MYGNTFRKLRPLTCVSPAQTAQPLPRLTPRPPPQRHPEGIATMREFASQNRIIMREKSTISSRPQSVKLPPVFGPSRARGLCPHPPAQRKTTTIVEYGIRAVQRKAELSRQLPYKYYRQERKEKLCVRAQRISQKESAISKRELKVGNKACLEPCLEVLYASEAKQETRDANRTRLKTEKNREALERKICENKMEGVVLAEPDEKEDKEKEEEKVMDLSVNIMWENINFVDEMDEEKKLVKSTKCKKKKMQEKAARSKEEVQNMALLIEQKKEEVKKLNYRLRGGKSDVISRKLKDRQYCEKMADVYIDIFNRSCSPYFPFEILSDFNDWSLDLFENTRPETIRKRLKEILKDYAMCNRLQKQAEADALREERREKRLARAFSPPVKIVGKKLMPRSPPPKKVKKEEPVETL